MKANNDIIFIDIFKILIRSIVLALCKGRRLYVYGVLSGLSLALTKSDNSITPIR